MAVLFLALLVTGCGSRQPDSLEPSTRSLPSLPPGIYVGPVQAQRSAAADSFTLLGDENADRSAGAVPDTGLHTMWLPASTAASEWALYSFSGLAGGDTPAEVEITLSDDLPARYWVGLGDYAIDTWRWAKVEPEGADAVDVRSLGQPVSAGGAFHVVVLAYGAEPARIAQLTLYVNLPPLPPTNVVAEPGVQSGQYVLSWSKADTATGYEVYHDSQLEAFDTVGDVDTWTDTEAGEQDRTYWLKSLNEHGASDFSEPAYGRTSPWQIQLIDTDGRYSTSLAVVDGKPVIAYVAVVVDMVETPHPRFARAATATPSGPDDWVISEWNEWGDAVNQTHIPWVAAVDGKPAFTIANRYYRALTATPSSRDDWEMHQFDADAHIDSHAPLIAYEGVPCVLYIDSNIDTLQLAHALMPTPSSSSDWDLSDIDTWEMVHTDIYSMNVIDNRLAVCYGHRTSDTEPGDLSYAYATTTEPHGMADWQKHVIEALPDFPSNLHNVDLIALASGKPAISYTGSGADYIDLRFARALTEAPERAADWVVTVIDPDFGWTGQGTSIALFEGKPLICLLYQNELNLVRSTAEDPSTPDDWYLESIESNMSEMNSYKDLEVINGVETVAFCSSSGLFLATRK